MIDKKKLKKTVKMLELIDNPINKMILDLLHTGFSMTVTDIVIKTRTSQPYVSTLLADLRKYEIVESYKTGKNVYYSINYDRIEDISKAINKFWSCK